MLNGGAVVRYGMTLRDADLEGVWTHLVYEMGGSVRRMEMWELSTGAVLLQAEYDAEASSEALYYDTLARRRDFLRRVIAVVTQQRVAVVDFLEFSPIPPRRRRVGLLAPSAST